MKVPGFIQQMFGSVIWRIQATSPVIYLTFDNGPNPEVTVPVLEILKSFRAKATFFCVGENSLQHPHLYKRILEEGHATGNHTFHHLNGWKTGTREYLHDIHLCEEAMKMEIRKTDWGIEKPALNPDEPGHIPQTKLHNPKLFRPPYGKLRLGQYSKLKSTYYIVMWDVLSGDFDHTISKEKCLQNVTGHAQSGSIVVFHDSMKAKKNMLFALPEMLDYFSKKNFVFNSLSADSF